jgi:hypothetical protein
MIRSVIIPSRRRNAIASPFGDQTGENECLSFVSRSSSAPLWASRMTTSVPKLSVLVAVR